MNKSFTAHISANWMKYIAVLIILPIVGGLLFNSLAQPKKNERVVITFFGDSIDIMGINDAIYKDKDNFTNQKLKTAYIDFILSDEPNINQLILADLEYSDMIIFTEDFLLKDESGVARVSPAGLFRFLGKENEPSYLEKIIGDKAKELEYFYDKDLNGVERPLGIYLDIQGEEKSLFEGYYTGKHRCVAFFCYKSVNIGEMFSGGNGTNTAAIDALLYLIGEK